jgi:hypothetical protein
MGTQKRKPLYPGDAFKDIAFKPGYGIFKS